jgi:hypothetical protein
MSLSEGKNIPNHYPKQKNLNKLFAVLGGKFKFSAQDSDLEYLCWRCKNSAVQVNIFQKLATSAEHVVYQNCSECQNKQKQQFVYTTCSADILSLQFS